MLKTMVIIQSFKYKKNIEMERPYDGKIPNLNDKLNDIIEI